MNEVKMTFRCGLAKVNVTFAGGSTAGIGITPAQFCTADPIIQNIIESSEKFKSGGIRIMKSDVIASDEDGIEEGEASQNIADEHTEEHAEQTDMDEHTSDLAQVEVASLADAKEYLATTFGYKKTQLRGVESVKQAGLSHGVEFVGSLD